MRTLSIALTLVALAASARAGAPATRHLQGADIPKVKTLASVDDAVGWTDANGAMAAVFSSQDSGEGDTHSAYLQVDLISLGSGGGKPKILRTVRDQVENCPVDLTLALLDGSIGVTDLDGDGTGELTFGYRESCKGDISPDTIKLLVLEGADKYILRGEDFFSPDDSGKRQGGAFKPDPAAAKWPINFLDHATRTWKRLVK